MGSGEDAIFAPLQADGAKNNKATSRLKIRGLGFELRQGQLKPSKL